MRIWDVPGQRDAVRALRDAAARDAVGHAWALIGPAGVGQRALARSLTAAVNCPVAPDGCGRCDPCVRSLRGAHPASWEFTPVGATHRVGDVRGSWMRIASRTAAGGSVKVLRVVDADRMNEAAANAFLKVLEEPPPRTVWLLELADPGELPDTVLSRCRTVRVAPWGLDTMRDAAARLLADGAADGAAPSPADVELATRAALGSPDRLHQLLADDGLADLHRHREIPRRLREDGPGHALLASRAIDDEMRRAVTAVRARARREREELGELYADAPPRDVVREIEQRATRREREARTAVAMTTLDDLACWYRDVLLVRTGGDVTAAVHADDAVGLRGDAAHLGPGELLASLDELFARRAELEFNVQLALAVEALLLDLSTIAMAGARSAG